MNVIDLHPDPWAQLVARRDKLPHALLLSGQHGIGKLDLARRFAESLLCEKPTETAHACGVCLACGWLAQGNHPDFRLLQPDALGDNAGNVGDAGDGGDGGDAPQRKKASQQITIGQVRAIDDFLHVGTHRHGARIIVINPAEAMNRATANALLKSLEEPIANTLFLLVSSEVERLLPTIRSRCQSVALAQPARQLAEQWLEQAGVGDAAHWLALAGGSPLLAVKLGENEERALLHALIGELARGNALDPFAAAAAVDRVLKAEKRPAPLKRMIEWSQKWIFDLTLVSQALPVRYFIARQPELQRLAKSTDTPRVLAFNRKTLQYKAQCEQPLNSRLFLEEFFLAYAVLFRTT